MKWKISPHSITSLENFEKYVPVLTEPAHEIETVDQFLRDEKGKEITLKWLTPQGEFVDSKASYETSRFVYVNQLKTPSLSDKKLLLKSSPYFVCELNEDLVYLEITSFMGDSEDLYYEQVMPLLEPYSGVIIDIRRNGGGNSYNGDIVFKFFYRSAFTKNLSALNLNFILPGFRMETMMILSSIVEENLTNLLSAW